jgi:hypothetical protein
MEPTNQNIPQNHNAGNTSIQAQDKSRGALIAVIVILFLIVIGGLYFLGQRMDRDYTKPVDTTATTSMTDPVTDSMKSQNSSDELWVIDADVKATNIDNVSQGASVIEAELQ